MPTLEPLRAFVRNAYEIAATIGWVGFPAQEPGFLEGSQHRHEIAWVGVHGTGEIALRTRGKVLDPA